MVISFKVSDELKDELTEHFKYNKRDKTPAYAVFQADEADTVVTLYESGKVVFQGVSADIDAALWKQRQKHLNPTMDIAEKNSDNKDKKDKKEVIVDPKIYNSSSIGSDEVGTGDYFGPIVVTASYVSKENISFLENLGVKDSKKMTDEKILEVVPKFIKTIPYESIVLSNREYNNYYGENFNMNKIKAVLHNKVLLKMKNKNFDLDYIIVDEFAKKFVYYNYLKESSEVCKGITFLTKGEERNLAVACASLISRYIFLNEFYKLAKNLDMFLPKGAGSKVDEVGVQIIKKYGIEKLNDISKLNFKNTEKINNLLNEKK